MTNGEKLLILRRRVGETQSQAAKRLKATLYTYRRWENDTEKSPNKNVGRLSDFEQCYVMRRRKEWSLEQMVKKVGVCRWWLCQMEKGEAPVERLVEFWNKAA